ncbi:hypothetical protein LTR64_000224 [Lithohypha guttulata]|uniref:uncharacterized protein n=1 Tax=Lithohypha guttulata TaxID=1690604 RepID=UPI002DE0B225|nr:hypothetical protein LTR51_007586 [Lithohypha guttulata]
MNMPHPRRTPPRNAVIDTGTQDRRKRQKLSHTPEPETCRQNPQTIGDEVPRSVRVLTNQESGESGSSDRSASKWFDNAAHKAMPAQYGSPEVDDEPPFYMDSRADYVPTNFVASDCDRIFGGRPSQMDSENEDLRGVIDDLTVENKRLKHMLRSQKSSRPASSVASQQQDKLFEVRMHGLPAAKRKELEYLLKNFATSLHGSAGPKSGSTSQTPSSAPDSGQGAPARILRTDSGYGSNSVSGKDGSNDPKLNTLQRSSKNKAVKTYLQDIPDTLLPRRNPMMSERAKQAIIVRRLEQLFTGRTAGPGNHDQPIQQQEISHSAARADRLQDLGNNRKRKAEGSREAHVMPADPPTSLDAVDDVESGGANKSLKEDAAKRVDPPEQRPTRPLDLDINRAQVAADNLSYIRHLGLSSSRPGIVDDEHSSWIFLNLLSGLAQLHTLNVTPDQVRKAIQKLSNRFEVSKDGHKIRWIGGSEGTKFSAEDEKEIENAELHSQEVTEDAGTGGDGSSRSKTSNSTSNAAITSHTPSEDKASGLHTSSGSHGQNLTTSALSNPPTSSDLSKPLKTSSAFDYKPIRFRGNMQVEHDDVGSDESFDSHSGDSSGLVHALSASNLNQQTKEEGPITFFNNPYFCSDFSSDKEPSNMLTPRPVIIGETLGEPVPAHLCESPLRYHDATYFTTHFAPKPFDADLLSTADRERFDKSLPKLPVLEPILEAGEAETVPMEMQACGLGGTTPEDNFALDVKVIRTVLPSTGPGAVFQTLPFSRRRLPSKFHTTISGCQKLDLLPPKLPPPSYVFFTSSSSSHTGGTDEDELSDDGDSSDTSSAPQVDEEYPAPPAFLQKFSHSSGGEQAEDEDDDDDSSEIDMLAIARQANPEQIAEQERVYMLTQPGYRPRAIAGSLAATVGASQSTTSIRDGIAGPSTRSEYSSRRVEGSDDGMEDA